MYVLKYLVMLVFMSFALVLFSSEIAIVNIFYKERKPSQQTLEKVNELLEKHKKNYQVNYFNIEDEKNQRIISDSGLADDHFPFAIVIDNKFNAVIGDKKISFIHFPDFMKGIGRHEGNWSLNDLEKVLLDNSLLVADKNLPELKANTTSCEND